MTIEQFKHDILPITLLHEGGYSDRRNDKGGETYRGISRKNNPDWSGWAIVDKLKPLSRGDVINDLDLKKAVAELYWKKYFKAHRFDEINSKAVQLALFDFAVNGGYSPAMLQRLLRAKFKSNIVVDGVIGKETLAAINAVAPLGLCEEVNGYRVTRFKHIVEEDPTQEENLDGWLKRARKINLECRSL